MGNRLIQRVNKKGGNSTDKIFPKIKEQDQGSKAPSTSAVTSPSAQSGTFNAWIANTLSASQEFQRKKNEKN